MVASGKAAARIDASRIGEEFRFNDAGVIEHLGEINTGERPQTAECVGGGLALSRFARVFLPHQIADRRVQVILDPALHGCESALFFL